MKNYISISKITLLALFIFGIRAMAQQQVPSYMSLEEAVNIAKAKNKTVAIAKTEEKAVQADYNDVVNAMFPTVTVAGAYQRFSDITLYDHGLSDSKTISRKPTPNVGNLGIDASVNLYSGGKQRAIIEENQYKKELSIIMTNDQSGNIGLQAAAQYLDIVRLYHQAKLIEDQKKRAETRLKNITSFYKNQRVTKSDLLRAELTLSNVLLVKEQNENDIIIGNQKLNLLLNIEESILVIPTDTILSPEPQMTALFGISDAKKSYPLQKIDMNLKIQSAKIKNIKSNNLPIVQLVSAYGFNYPNNIFYPPVDQIFSVGYVGMKMSYNISSVYQNKNKEIAAKQRLIELDQQKEWVSDNLKQEIKSLYIKYNEALNRISVTEKSIEQARVNYEIINTKYLNQLALLTDLLDADNLYQESRYNYISAQTNAMIIYYKLLYTTGNL